MSKYLALADSINSLIGVSVSTLKLTEKSLKLLSFTSAYFQRYAKSSAEVTINE